MGYFPETEVKTMILRHNLLQNKSIACSTPAALAWDEAWSKSADPSGRAIAGVHVEAYKEK